MIFALKTIVAGLLIAFASWLAGKKPVLAGFIITLPLTSVIAILFSYAEYRDMDKINRFAQSIFVAVPLSLMFFVPFLFNRWVKMNFAVTFLLSILFLGASYYMASAIFKIKL